MTRRVIVGTVVALMWLTATTFYARYAYQAGYTAFATPVGHGSPLVHALVITMPMSVPGFPLMYLYASQYDTNTVAYFHGMGGFFAGMAVVNSLVIALIVLAIAAPIVRASRVRAAARAVRSQQRSRRQASCLRPEAQPPSIQCQPPDALHKARPEGLEPPTDRVETGCSIRLSYGRRESGRPSGNPTTNLRSRVGRSRLVAVEHSLSWASSVLSRRHVCVVEADGAVAQDDAVLAHDLNLAVAVLLVIEPRVHATNLK